MTEYAPIVHSNRLMDAERWARGLSIKEYLAGMQCFQTKMRRRLDYIRLTPFERKLMASLQTPLNVLVMTEDWCSDSLMNLPVLAQAAWQSELMDLRIFPRSKWPDLRAAYEARGILAIPVATFMDTDFNEIGTWVERPQVAHRQLEAWIAAHPEWEAIRHNPDLTPDEKRDLMVPLRALQLEEMEDWYDLGFQSDTVAEIRAILKGYLAE